MESPVSPSGTPAAPPLQEHPGLAAAREAIYAHLSTVAQFRVLSAVNWWEPAWAEKLASLSPQFVLLSDEWPLLRAFAAFTLGACRVDCVLISDLAFEGPRVLAHCLAYPQAAAISRKPIVDYASAIAVSQPVLPQQRLQDLLSLFTDLSANELLVACAGRLALVIIAIASTIKPGHQPDQHWQLFVKALLLHTLLLDLLPLEDRAFSSLDAAAAPPSYTSLLHDFFGELRIVLRSAHRSATPVAVSLLARAFDCFDGRLFGLLMQQTSADVALTWPAPLYEALQGVYRKAFALAGAPDSITITPWPRNEAAAPAAEAPGATTATAAPRPKLLPFNSQLVRDLLPGYESMWDTNPTDIALPSSKIPLFQESYHSGKELAKDDRRHNAAWEDRQRQKYVAFMHRYAESLSGTVAPETIILKPPSESKAARKKEKEKPAKESTKAKQIKADNERNQRAKARGDAEQQLKTVMKNALPGTLTKFIKECKSEEVAMQASAQHLQQLADALAAARRANVGVVPCAVETMRWLFQLHHRAEASTGADAKVVAEVQASCARVLLRLGFNGAVQLLSGKASPVAPPKDLISIGYTSASLFQLENMGPFMRRNTEGERDERVVFTPDKWQTRLLDIIDERQSALVVAPTSSGKTFISYYAMRKVLEESLDGVVVYVAPTKALVNQVCAEVYARYSNAPAPNGHSAVGVFTRDYRHNYLTCRILVTVPQCLEILLLSPQQRSWVARLKYVIFDEVHSIGEIEGGTVWEHLLLMIPCPFVALSATVGNPEAFHEWLVKARKNFNQRVQLVRHEARYSELRKLVYLPTHTKTVVAPAAQPQMSLDDDDALKAEIIAQAEHTAEPTEAAPAVATGAAATSPAPVAAQAVCPQKLMALHPAAMLSARDLRKNGFPADMAFESRDTLRMFEAMQAALPESERLTLAQLSPDAFFKSQLDITQADSRRYEVAVKEALVGWARSGKDELVTKVLQSIAGDLRSSLTEYEQTHDATSRGFLYRNIIPFLRHLQQARMLPALVFSFDRYMCTRMAVTVDRVMHTREKAARKERAKDNTKQLERLARKAKSTKDKPEDDEDTKILPESNVDPDQPDDEYSFVPRNEAVPIGEIKRLITKDWLHKNEEIQDLLAALYRGIGVHHGGLPKKYQQLVEVLFRRRHLRVVFATGTLALGINMPCPTVVFAGDSNFLNPLQYRQMSGRAGRRGFDDLGNVVFFGLPQGKIVSLLSSPLPTLRGHFPLTVSTILRCFQLIVESSDQTVANSKAAVANMLQQPFFSSNKNHLQEQMAHHFRFSLEYLRRQQLINREGKPVGYAGLVSHLYYTEPANFVFFSALKSGLLEQICETENTDWETTSCTLLLLLCHLFGRVPLHRRLLPILESEDAAARLLPSKVRLQALTPAMRKSLSEHNKHVLTVYESYIVYFCTAAKEKLGRDVELPLSKLSFRGKASSVVGNGGALQRALHAKKIPVAARSPFIALSGHGDQFEHIEDLVESVRSNIFLDWSAIPVLRTHGDNNKEVLLNAYLMDFYRHGQLSAIYRANQIRQGEAWGLLKDFSLVLKVIAVAFENYSETNCCRRALSRLAAEFAEKLAKQAA